LLVLPETTDAGSIVQLELKLTIASVPIVTLLNVGVLLPKSTVCVAPEPHNNKSGKPVAPVVVNVAPVSIVKFLRLKSDQY
jgi:hypothetical protein